MSFISAPSKRGTYYTEVDKVTRKLYLVPIAPRDPPKIWPLQESDYGRLSPVTIAGLTSIKMGDAERRFFRKRNAASLCDCCMDSSCENGPCGLNEKNKCECCVDNCCDSCDWHENECEHCKGIDVYCMQCDWDNKCGEVDE
jgi:hypothetical protein